VKHTARLLALTAALGVALAADPGQNERKELRVGYLPNIVLPQPLIGLQDGEYARLVPGVTFKGFSFPAGPAVLEALRAGTVDVAYTGPFPPMNAYMKSRDVILLAGAAKGGTELLVAKDSPIRSVQDLKGKVVGVNQFGSTVDVMVRFNLAKAGLNPDRDVRLIEIAPAEQADALKRGEAAAVASPAPWPSDIVRGGNGRALLNWRTIFDNGDYLQGVLFTTKKFAQENPNLVRNFVNAHRAITNQINRDRVKGDAAVLAAWSKETKKTLPANVARSAFATIKFTNAADLAAFQRLADVTYDAGIIREKGSLEGFLYK
jgi:NitT/TauT family transport system substrate-binding protein